MRLLDLILIAVALGVAAALVCRLDTLHFRTHWWPLIVLHVALIGGVSSAVAHAWSTGAGLQDWCVVLAALAWIVVSLQGWKDVVKPFQETVPTDLDQLDYPDERRRST